MGATIKTYCIACDDDVEANIVEKADSLTIRSENVEYTASIAKCPRCGSEIGDSSIEAENLERAYGAYRIAHGLVSPGEISDLRRETGLSLREFSRFLGFGEQTAAKYEGGAIPDLLHSNTIRMASQPEGAVMLLEMNRGALSQQSINKVENYIERIAEGSRASALWQPIAFPIGGLGDAPSSKNGYRALDFDRVAALASMLAGRCTDLYKTKFQKAMFFCDFSAFERFGRSITGLAYAHADYGPIVNAYESVIGLLVSRGYLVKKPRGWGEVLEPADSAPAELTADEAALVSEVVEFVDSFPSATELSCFSHNLEAWSTTASGQVIDYGINHGEVSAAISERLSTSRA